MRCALVGYGRSGDPRYVGGQQTVMRRLGRFLGERKSRVDFLVLEGREERQEWQGWGRILGFRDLPALLRSLSEPYDLALFTRLPLKTYPKLLRYLVNRPAGGVHAYFYLVWPSRAVSRLARRTLFGYFDVVAAASSRLLREAQRAGPPSFLFLPPVPDAYFQVGAARLGESPTDLKVGYLGRIGPDKGLHKVTETLSGLSELAPRLHPLVRGYWDRRDAQARALHETLTQALGPFYVGQPALETLTDDLEPERRVAELLAQIDVLLLPYQALENVTLDTPLLLLEAMACGCGVLTTPVADLPELLSLPEAFVQKNGFRQALRGLLEGERLQSLRRCLYQRAIDLGLRLPQAGERFLREVGLG
ncbi:MAG: glycosyltransferase [Anaerolineae bacterium]